MSKLSQAKKTHPHRYADTGEASHIYLLPNSMTAGNLFFGFLAILRCIQASQTNDPIEESALFTQAVWFILFGVICDSLDGRLARLGGRESLFGKEFDSIADIISFGVAPTLMMIFLILSPTEEYPFFLEIGWLIGFVYLLCAGIRLARFNVLTSPVLPPAESIKNTQDFIGLPVPAAAGMIASLVLVLNSFDLRSLALLMPPFMLAIAFLMISNIPYPSFKKIDWNTSTRLYQFFYLIFTLAILFLFKELSFVFIFLSYILFGPLRALFRVYKAKKLLRNRDRTV